MFKENVNDNQQTLIKIKKEILNDLEKRVVEKVLEPANYALLKKLIEKAETADEAIKIAELGTTYKRTGFHFDKRLEKSTNTISYFKKNKDLSFIQDKNAITHKLIIGDNYLALLNLLIEYRGKVDVIYIDPPYGKDSMGEFAKTNYQNNITRDNLLSMLYPRLMLAKQLLSNEGVIFCSIDDRNQAYVKCLFDEVFEERNYIETFIWNKTSTPPALSHKSRKTHEFILCYSKTSALSKFVGLTNSGGDAPLLNEANRENILTFPANYVLTNLKDGKYYAGSKERVNLMNDIIVKNGVITTEFSLCGRFRWQQNTLNKEIDNGCKLIIKSEKFAIRYCRKGEREVAPANYILEKIYKTGTSINKTEQNVDTNEKAGEILSEILGNKIFDFPKPTSLISYLINFIDAKIVLDFFAGSGTTGQAVLELNKQDGGKRQFIGVQLNENLDEALKQDSTNLVIKAQIELCDKYNRPHELSEITVERLRRVMTGKCYDGSSDFEWIKKNDALGDNLDVYNIAEVANFASTSGQTPFDVIDETLYCQEHFKTIQEKVEWVCKNFEGTQKRLEEDDANRS